MISRKAQRYPTIILWTMKKKHTFVGWYNNETLILNFPWKKTEINCWRHPCLSMAVASTLQSTCITHILTKKLYYYFIVNDYSACSLHCNSIRYKAVIIVVVIIFVQCILIIYCTFTFSLDRKVIKSDTQRGRKESVRKACENQIRSRSRSP